MTNSKYTQAKNRPIVALTQIPYRGPRRASRYLLFILYAMLHITMFHVHKVPTQATSFCVALCLSSLQNS